MTKFFRTVSANFRLGALAASHEEHALFRAVVRNRI